MDLKIFIAGANGGIGRQVVEQALQAGFEVTALVRDAAKLQFVHANLKIVTGDIMQPASFAHYLQGQDVVISALGVSGGNLFSDKPTKLYSEGCSNLIAAMARHGVNRLFCISASALEVSPVIPWYVRFIAKYVIQKLLKYMYADLRDMEAIAKTSKINWTIIRPPQLTDGPATGHYRYAINNYLKDCLKISRADVAHLIIHQLTNDSFEHATVEVGY